MTLQFRDFAKEYSGRLDEDLLRLVLVSSDLTDEARLALTSELTRRGLSEQQVREFEMEETERKQQLESETGKLFFLPHYGIGRNRFCKGDCVFDEVSGFEEFTTTIFVILFWIPLVPTGTFRVRRTKRFMLGSEMEVLRRLPMNWGQVAVVWSLTIFILLGILTALKLALLHLR